jgi:transcriptional regulator with XRE-family HTH domain
VKPLKRLAENLRYIRQVAGATQSEFSIAIGFEFRFYQRLEDAERESLQFSTITRLAKAVGLEPWELLAPGIARRKFQLPNLIRQSKGRAKG